MTSLGYLPVKPADTRVDTPLPGRQANYQGLETARPIAYWHYSGEEKTKVNGWLVREIPLVIFVDGQEWVTLMCSPHQLPYLVVGFLFSEGIIRRTGDIAYMSACQEDGSADVKLNRSASLPTRRVLSSGCGGGIGFKSSSEVLPRLNCDLTVQTARVTALAGVLVRTAKERRRCGGTHMSALSDGERIPVLAEDIGRHNTLDRIKGECMLRDIPSDNRAIITTGRISSEMVLKAGRMGVPVLISLTTPTDEAISLAERMGITVAGYVRGNKMRVYSHPSRLKDGPVHSNSTSS